MGLAPFCEHPSVGHCTLRSLALLFYECPRKGESHRRGGERVDLILHRVEGKLGEPRPRRCRSRHKQGDPEDEVVLDLACSVNTDVRSLLGRISAVHQVVAAGAECSLVRAQECD
jgi:hypothetical protein